MTKINDPANLTGKLFGYKVKYSEVEGLETPNTDFSTLKVKPKYNGNIAEVDWRTGTTTGDNLRRYGYVYDGVNRLLAGFYQKDTNPSAKEYFEKMEYDLNGNISNLKRSAQSQQGAPAFNIDDLGYIYTGNRLTSVTDSSTDYRGYPDTSGNTISYYLNGNMKDHKDKGILQIDYNFLNLPNYLKFDRGLSNRSGIINENTNYLYRADGTKLRKVYNYAPPNPLGTITQLSSKITEYLDGFQYEGTGKKGTAPAMGLKFVPTSEGYYNFENNKYIYNYTDHLGNIRLSYFNNGSGAEVLEENNYYPFGMKHEDYNVLPGNPVYKYSYNGKELQTESGMYDYGARFYMADIGRWGVVDPLAETSRRWNPYAYAFDNPIRFIDPDGRQPEWIVGKDGKAVTYKQNKDGSLTWSENATEDTKRIGNQMARTETGLGRLNKMRDVKYGVELTINKTVTDNENWGETTYPKKLQVLDRKTGEVVPLYAKMEIFEATIAKSMEDLKAAPEGSKFGGENADNTNNLFELWKTEGIDTVIGAIGVHEGNHGTDRESLKLMGENLIKKTTNDLEVRPNAETAKHIEEIKKINKKNETP